MDADHHRCVITLAGEPECGGEAAILGTGKAMELIDLTKHSGAQSARWRHGRAAVYSHRRRDHRRLRGAGAASGQRNLEALPDTGIFLRRAATRPERVNLENVRRGQFEGLREELKKNLDRQPDVWRTKAAPHWRG